MNRLPLLVLTGAVLLTACSQSTPSAPTTTPTSQSAQVSFRLTAPQGVTPNVTILGPEGFNKTITSTGTAWFETLKFGTYTWNAANVTSGDFTYAAASGKVDLAAGDDKEANVTYAPIDSALNFTLHAPDGVTPSVTLSGPDNFRKTFTTAGTSKLTGLKPGAYTWTATDVTADNFTYVATGGSVNLVAGEATGVTDTYAALVGTLDLTVTAPPGVTPDVTVTGPDNFSRTITGAGAFKLAGLKPGAYTVAGRSVVLNGVRHSAPDANTTVEVGQTAAVSVSYDDGVDIEAPTNVTVTPTSAAADASGFVTLTLTAQDNVAVKEFKAYIGDVKMATLQASKSADGYSATYSPWIPAGTDWSFTFVASDGVNVSARSAPVTVTGQTVGHLELTVSAPEGVTPNVTVTGPDNFSMTFTRTGTFGLFELNAGVYTVARADVTVNGVQYAAREQTVTVAAGRLEKASVLYDDGLDLEAPTGVTFTPSNATVNASGSVRFTATAQDNVAVKEFIVYSGTGNITITTLQANRTADGFTADFTPWIPPGYTLSFTVVASDGVNVSARSPEVTAHNPN